MHELELLRGDSRARLSNQRIPTMLRDSQGFLCEDFAMDDFAPWQILHAPFDVEPPEDQFPDGLGGVYVVLWRSGQPVGDAWFSFENARLTPAEAVARAWSKLPPGKTAPVVASSANALPESRSLVSVVVCSRDRAETLARALTAIGRLLPAPDEVIVVDNAPINDATKRCVARFPGVRYVCEPRPGLDRARNAGIKAASGAIIAFTDDDEIGRAHV